MTTLNYIHIFFTAKNNCRERWYCQFCRGPQKKGLLCWPHDISGLDHPKRKNQINFINKNNNLQINRRN